MKQKNIFTKENIKLQSIMFILIVAFIVAFKNIFGAENILIGTTTIAAMLMFMNIDLTMAPISNLIMLIVLNITTGIGAYISLLNPWIGIPINFAIVFFINYKLYFNLKDSLYVPFTLQYAFILATPVTLDKMPIRIAALLVAPIAIMIMQIIFNKQKIFKKGNRIIENVCGKIIEKIDIILDEEKPKDDIYEIDRDIRKYIDEFRAIVYDNRKERFYITEEARIKVNILSSLEKISINLNRINEVEGLESILMGLRQCMKRLKVVLGEDNNIEELEKYITKVEKKHEDVQTRRIRTLEILNSLAILRASLNELRLLGKENYNKVKDADNIESKNLYLEYNKKFMINSVKLSFAIRSAIGISLAAFITDYFNLRNGNWIIFTIIAVLIPIYETSIKKYKDRLLITVLGVASIVILFSIFKSITIRSLIIMLVGYISSYLNEYRYKTVCNLILAFGIAALIETNILDIDKLVFIVIGIILSLIINKIIMPRRIEDYTKELERVYLESVKGMLKKLYLSSTENNMHTMNNLFIITSLVDSRLENIKGLLNKRARKSISQNKLLILNIHELYMLFTSDKFKNIDSKYIIEDMKLLTSFTDQNVKEFLDKIERHIKKSEDAYQKLMLENIREVYKEIHKINKFIS